MFNHVMMGANDLESSRVFYDAIMQVLGFEAGVLDSRGRYVYTGEESFLGLTKPINGEAATVGNGMTIGFKTESTEQVDRWFNKGLAHGGTECEDPPGVRQRPSGPKYLAYLRDPSGNKLCAIYSVK